ncbi:MAG: HEAT repeat domain-containing protein, partial [Chloroflexi bacterium]|nr:HEAT repeat domain-containing protein [Chloroflexota bacterium]
MNFEEYLEELANSSRKLKIADLQRLSGLSAEQTEQLAARWTDIDAHRRHRILQELIDLAEDTVELNFDAVFRHALEDGDAEVRLAAVRGLWEHESPELIDSLTALTETDDSAAVRAEAALALGRFVLLFELGRLRERHFERAAVALRRVIENAGEIEEVRARAIEAIGPHDATWVRQSVTQAYESGSHRLKVSAVHAMGRSAEPRWLPLIKRELASDEAELRYEAAVASGSLADEAAVPNLVPLLADSDDEVRAAAIAALGEIGGEAARRALDGLIDGSSKETSAAAAAALADIEADEDPLRFKLNR